MRALAMAVAALAVGGCSIDRAGMRPGFDGGAGGGDGAIDAPLPDAIPPDGATCLTCHVDADCEDGHACTSDRCVDCECTVETDDTQCTDAPGGECTATLGCVYPDCPTGCDDANPCTDDRCDPGAGGCTHTPNAATCDDGDACTTGDA